VTTRRARLGLLLRAALGNLLPATPDLLAAIVFGAGVVLLVSGATPGVEWRLRWLDDAFPLAVIELSHFSASVAGVVLLILARGLHLRLDAARHVTIVALAVGIVGSLLKGLDYEEALTLTMVLGAVIGARRQFYRRSSITGEPWTTGWIAAVALVIAGTTWLGLFSYRHVAYSGDLWWHFATRADAPRFLRATVGVAVAAIGFAVARLMRPAAHVPPPPRAEDIARVRTILEGGARCEANLALLGDKAILLGDRSDSFLMYAVRGRSWVALGDPIGPPDAQRALITQFRTLAHHFGGRPVFYGVGAEQLALYADQGLGLYKVGEEARVSLEGWSLQTPEHRRLRTVVRQLERLGCRFEVVPADRAGELLTELRRVSDAWLAHKRAREKGFSLGRFDERYLSHFPVAVVRRDGDVIAFANLWRAGDRRELSVDLMRHVPDAVPGLMDYLFAQVMAWGAQEGYRWFNLGMAPLSGFRSDEMATRWSRLGALVFAHGEPFYNFRGLRQYKEKFRPEWRPRFLASAGGLALPGDVASITSLVSGGLGGVVRK
jgi:phosphatidylglycerol lysyltransferase